MKEARIFGLGPRIFRVLQAAWFLIAVGAAAWRTAAVGQPDAVAISALILGIAALLAPAITEVNIGGNSIKLQQTAKTLDETSNALAIVTAKLILMQRRWITTIASSQGMRRMALDVDALILHAVFQCEQAIADARQFLVPSDDSVRVSLWIEDPNDPGTLKFQLGNVTDLERTNMSGEQFTTGDDDYIGIAWRENRIVNELDAAQNWRAYNPETAERRPLFRGVMFVPIDWQGRRWGLLEVDRVLRERFDANAEIVASALGNYMAVMLADAIAERGSRYVSA
jgi:GAF domain-containing protein